MSVLLFLLLSTAIVTLVTGQCTPGESRLVGGTSPRDGVMEICTVKGTWGTVCGYGFGCEEANVACHQLGFQNFSSSYYTNRTGLAKRPSFGMYSCSGTESSLLNCSHSIYWSQGLFTDDLWCGRTRVVGIKCPSLPAPDCISEGSIRLIGGNVPSEGQLQICFKQHWTYVCQRKSWYSLQLGSTVCKQLGYHGKWHYVVERRQFTLIDPIFHMGLYCKYNYDNISLCQSYSCSSCNEREIAVKCVYESEGCVNGSLRLIGGNTMLDGIVQICIDGVWGVICKRLNTKEMSIACVQMGLTFSEKTKLRTKEYRLEHGPVIIRRIRCDGTENNLLECHVRYINTKRHCDVTDDIFSLHCVDGCINGDVRLTGGINYTEGTVEICVNGVWMLIGGSLWDDIDATVVCKQLNLTTNYTKAFSSSPFKIPFRQIYYTNVACNGGEMKIGNCLLTLLSYNQQKNITNIAAVYCGDTPPHVTSTTMSLESTKNMDVSLYQMPSSSSVVYSSKLSSAETMHSSSNDAIIIGSFLGGAAVFGGLSIICVIILFRCLYKAKKIKTQDREVIEMQPNIVYGIHSHSMMITKNNSTSDHNKENIYDEPF